ncbi:MAG TPA: hypothetical protein VFU13_23315 [Steroidobacteraceae bacterium]|nr:hypothetical protein [Steroidobacteraceae bacterium]
MNKVDGDIFNYELLVPADVTETKLREDLEKAWKEGLESDAWLQETVRREQIPAGEVPFKTKGSQGVDPVTAAILIALGTGAAKLSVKMATDIWDRIVLPWLERKYGRGAVRRR